MEIFVDVLLETLLDSAKLIPVLFLTYLIMEAVEHYAGERTFNFIRKSRGIGPLAGGLLGVVPQCGIAGGAANLYAARVITAGTLISVLLATSDEMLPILISSGAGTEIFKLVGFKLAFGVVAGFAVDICLRLVVAAHRKKAETVTPDAAEHGGHGDEHGHEEHGHGHRHEHTHEGDGAGICTVCEREGCDCEHGIFLPALKHTLRVGIMIFVISLALGLCFEYFGADAIAALPVNAPVIGELLAGLIGLIPNCSVSVILTNLYLEGIVGTGTLMSGLLVNGGIGLLVLYRMNRGRGKLRENLILTGVMLLLGISGGLLAGAIL